MRDFIQAGRSLLARPGFTAAAVVTLALGIGATTAIWSVVYGVLIRPLPYADADRLVWTGGSLPDLEDVSARTRSFSGLAMTASNRYAADLGGGAVQLRGDIVTTNFFDVTGIAPALGRTFTAAQQTERVAVIADRLWRGPYGSDPAILGRTMRLNGKVYRIIGVMPASLGLPSPETVVWTPLEEALIGWGERDNRQLRIAQAFARLAPGVDLPAAQAAVGAVMADLGAEYPDTNEQVGMILQPLHEAIVSRFGMGDVRPALLVLLGTVALVLVIAAGNVANLMLARTASRERELAIRLALGAGRARVARLILSESVLLALAGGALGVLFALWGVSLLLGLSPADFPRVSEVAVDVPVLGFALVVSLAVACLFALAPIFGVLRPPLATLLTTARSATEGRRAGRLRAALVVIQVALSLVLVTGAALLLTSLVNMMRTERGYDSENLLTFTMPPDASNAEVRQQFLERAMHRIAELPGVVAVGGASSQPPDTLQRETRFVAEGGPDDGAQDSPWIVVTPDYFAALGTGIVAGRAFTAQDAGGTEPVIAVNRSLARRLAPGGQPVGMRLRLLVPGIDPRPRTIVGVVEDIKYTGLNQDGDIAIFTPWAQTPWPGMYAAVRTRGEPMSLARAIGQALAALDPGQTVVAMRNMEDVTADSLIGPRFYGLMLGLFGALALTLAAIGVYGVIAYDVVLRTREIGIRLALGARPRAVVAMMVRRGSLLAMAGVAIGIAGGVAATRVLAGMLYGVGVADPRVVAGAAALLLAVAAVASLGAARRVARVDPIRALRAD